jgi:nucleoid-associated protein YgaU
MTEATQQQPAPAGRPARTAVPVVLVLLCLLGAGGVYLHERSLEATHTAATPAATTAPAVAASQSPPAATPGRQAALSPVARAPAPEASAPPASAPVVSTSAASPPAVPAPSVDVVRVDKNGALVMAGRAVAGETLTIRNGDTVLGEVTADADGQWVFLPDAPLPTGVHQLSLSEEVSTTKPAAAPATRTTVLLNIPAAGGPVTTSVSGGTPLNAGPMVVVSQGAAAPRLLLAPPGSRPGAVGLDIVQYDEKGRIRFTGHARPGRVVRLYVDNHAVGDAVADPSGAWSLSPGNDLAPGIHKLRTDELAPGGKVSARSEVPFARADLAEGLPAGHAVVQPGDCLWTIARHSYGHGVQYTAIFQANLDQIKDPDLIYPGQAFRMPTSDEAAHAPPIPKREGGKTRQGKT